MTKILDTSSRHTYNTSDDIIHYPMLVIKPINHKITSKKYDILIITSVNAIINYKHHIECDRAIVVGNEAKDILQLTMNIDIQVVANVSEIISILTNIFDRKTILYLCGKHISKDIRKYIGQNIILDSIITYDAVKIKEIDPKILKMLENGDITTVNIHSLRGYIHFLKMTDNIKYDAKMVFHNVELMQKCKSYNGQLE